MKQNLYSAHPSGCGIPSRHCAVGAFHLLLGILLLGCCLAARAALPEIPAQPRPVSDLTATLSTSQQQALTRQLLALEQQTGSQLALLIVPGTGEQSIEQFSLRVVEQWQLGRKDVDDGVLLLLAKDDRRLRIEVGYGLEGQLTDALASRIIHDSMLPLLRQGDFHAAIQAGVDHISAAISQPPRSSERDGPSPLQHKLLLAGILAIVVPGLFGRLLGWLPVPRLASMALCSLLAAGATGYLLQDLLQTLGYEDLLLALGSGLCAALWYAFDAGAGGSGPGGGSAGGSSGGFAARLRAGFRGGRGGRFGGGGSSGNW